MGCNRTHWLDVPPSRSPRHSVRGWHHLFFLATVGWLCTFESIVFTIQSPLHIVSWAIFHLTYPRFRRPAMYQDNNSCDEATNDRSQLQLVIPLILHESIGIFEAWFLFLCRDKKSRCLCWHCATRSMSIGYTTKSLTFLQQKLSGQRVFFNT